MSSNQKNSGIKSTLEFGPVIVFFAAYILFDRYEISLDFYGQNYEGFVLATTIFIPLILFTTFLSWKLTGEVSKIQLFTAILVVVFGGMTILFNDDRFFKMKPTLVYFLFGSILLVGLFRGKSYLKEKISKSYTVPIDKLSFNKASIDYIKEIKNRHRDVYMITGSHQLLVKQIEFYTKNLKYPEIFTNPQI